MVDSFDVAQLRGMAQSVSGVAMDVDDQDDAATCMLAVDWMQDAANEIVRLREALADIAYKSVAPDDLAWCQRKAQEALKKGESG